MRKTTLNTCQSTQEKTAEIELLEELKTCPIEGIQLFANMGLFLPPKHLSRILFLDYIYKKIIDVQGIIIDFGTRWGNSTGVFSSLRGIYEPFNRHRVIVGFDTFEGLLPPTQDDKGKRGEGDCSTVEGWENRLSNILSIHGQFDPLAHIDRFEICKGDVAKTFPHFLERRPETIVALAFFDMDFYKPTKDALTTLLPRLTKGSILAFDELNDPMSPGETTALMEVLGLPNVRLQRYRYASRVSYIVME